MSSYKDLEDLVKYYQNALSASGANAVDYASLYGTAAQHLIDAQNAAYQNAVSQYQAQIPQIQQSYDQARNDAYTNARLSAIGSNEVLAAKGLAGNLYQDPKSGVSETSRIAMDNQLRGDINTLTDSELSAIGDVNADIAEAGLQKDQNIAQIRADMIKELNAYQQELRQAAVDNAMKEVQLFGQVMTQESANALGVPVGTLSYTAGLAAQKAASAGSGGGGGGSSSKSSSNYDSVRSMAVRYKNMSPKSTTVQYYAKKNNINTTDVPKVLALNYLKRQYANQAITRTEYYRLKNELRL